MEEQGIDVTPSTPAAQFARRTSKRAEETVEGEGPRS